MRKSFHICCVLICLHSSLLSQHLPITMYNPRNGAAVNGAVSIFQDSKGWIWFASGYDIIRYDGNSFKVYPPARMTRMDFCYEVIEADNEIWVLSDPYPLKVKGDSLYPLQLGSFSRELINATATNGRHYILAANGLHVHEKGGLQPFITDDKLNFNHTPTGLFPLNDSFLLTYKFEEALIVFDIRSKAYRVIDLPVHEVQQDANGTIYVLVKDQGIFLLRNFVKGKKGWEVNREPVYFTERARFAVDHERNLWIYNQGGHLVMLEPDGKTHNYTESDGLPNTEFNTSLVDREGNLWLGFANGLCKIVRSDVTRFTRDQGLPFNYVSYFSDGPGNLLFVSTRNGLGAIDNNKIYNVTDKSGIFSCGQILKGKNNDYLFIRDSALFTAQFDAHHYRIHNEKLLGTFPGLTIQVIAEKTGSVFIATTRGLFYYNEADGIRQVGTDSRYYRSIYIDKKDRLWAGEFVHGLHGFTIQYGSAGKFSVKEFIELDTIRAIRAMSENSAENLVVGTRFNGLFCLRFLQDSLVGLRHLSEMDGVNSNNIWGIATDSSGAFWIASSRGLNKLKMANDDWVITDEGASRQIYQATHVFTASDNRIWVGNHPGVVVINNKPVPTVPFTVRITSINVNGKNIDTSGWKNRFSFRENNINIVFSANTFLDENAVLYTYRLSGKQQAEWSKPAPIHSINFSSLGPGNYTVHIKAVNPNGQWSENEAVYNFSVLPPFWQQAWFLGLVVLLVLAGLYALYRYRVRRMQELFEMRNVIASDLHDEIGSTLTSINILSKVSHNNISKDQEKASSLLKEVIDQSQQIQQSMSDIVWAIKPDNDKMENMIARMREYVNYTLEPKDIRTDFDIGENIRKETLDMQQRRDFFLVFKEAVTNIAKYSEAGNVHLQMERHDGNIRLYIKDDGKGFTLPAVSLSNGLKNMQRRAESLKGKIAIHSSPGNGTSIELIFPATS